MIRFCISSYLINYSFFPFFIDLMIRFCISSYLINYSFFPFFIDLFYLLIKEITQETTYLEI